MVNSDLPPQPHHTLSVRRTLGSLQLQADLKLTAPWTLIYGPSGSGKSSLLHAACGFMGGEGVTFTRNSATQQSQVLIDSEHALAPHQLSLSYAPQSPTLFPHMRVLENITYGTSCRGINTHGPLTVTELLDIFELEPLLLRRPHELSGGERQRVSLARAFAVPEVKLMLLDEPFSGVDRAMRDRLLPRMQHYLRHRAIPVLSVSHDADEAILLGAEVVRLRNGKITAQGPATTTLADEKERLLKALNTADE